MLCFALHIPFPTPDKTPRTTPSHTQKWTPFLLIHITGSLSLTMWSASGNGIEGIRNEFTEYIRHACMLTPCRFCDPSHLSLTVWGLVRKLWNSFLCEWRCDLHGGLYWSFDYPRNMIPTVKLFRYWMLSPCLYTITRHQQQSEYRNLRSRNV